MSDHNVLPGVALVLLGGGQWPPRDPQLRQAGCSEERDTMQGCSTRTGLVVLGRKQWLRRGIWSPLLARECHFFATGHLI